MMKTKRDPKKNMAQPNELFGRALQKASCVTPLTEDAGGQALESVPPATDQLPLALVIGEGKRAPPVMRRNGMEQDVTFFKNKIIKRTKQIKSETKTYERVIMRLEAIGSML
jgi:hypothetical protein